MEQGLTLTREMSLVLGLIGFTTLMFALEWVRAILGVTWDELYAEAFTVAPGAEGLIFLPYLTGERTPYFDSTARGAWIGLRLGHTRGHLLRARVRRYRQTR